MINVTTSNVGKLIKDPAAARFGFAPSKRAVTFCEDTRLIRETHVPYWWLIKWIGIGIIIWMCVSIICGLLIGNMFRRTDTPDSTDDDNL